MKVTVPIMALGLGFVCALTGCAKPGAQPEPTPEKPHNVEVMVLGATQQTAQKIEISGPVIPVRGVDLSAEEAGVVVEINRDKGEAVKAGDVILAQDRVLMAAEQEAALADLKARNFDLEKMQKLFAAGKISELDLLQSENNQAQAAARAETAQHRYRRAAVSAPFDGVVVDRFVELGQYLLPAQRAARVIDPSTLKLVGYLTDSQVGPVSLDQTCTVNLGDLGISATGRIGFISCEADLQTGKFKVEVLIQNPEGQYKSGVIGRAVLSGGAVTGIPIPRDVVLTGLTGASVFTVHKGRAARRAVRLGPAQGAMVSVRDGLAPGDTLVVNGQRALRDGNRVNITQGQGRP